MSKHPKKRPMKVKIALIFAVPFIGYFIASLITFLSNLSVYQGSSSTISELKAIKHISEVVKQMQVERGKSAVYVKNSNLQVDFIESQREKVDNAIKKADKAVEALDSTSFKKQYAKAIEKVKNHRILVNNKKPPKEFLPRYTATIHNLIDIQSLTSSKAPPPLNELLSSMVSLEKARDYAGLLRATIASTFASDAPVSIGVLKKLVSLDASLKKSLDTKYLNVSPKIVSNIEKFSEANHWQSKSKYVDLILEKSATGKFDKDGPATFKLLTMAVNDIGALITDQFSYLEEKGAENLNLAMTWMLVNLIIFTATILLMSYVLLKFIKGFERDVESVLNEIKNANVSISSSSDKIKDSGTALTAASHQASSAVQETVSSMSEIKSMTNQSTEKTAIASSATEKVAQDVSEGESSLSSLLDSMNEVSKATKNLDEINEAIDSIAKRTGVINDIVFKTQLLSFNASIEAAKAGEHGRGFAVVAEEVGKLADMSGSAAEEISTLLDESRKKIGDSIKTNQALIEEGLKKSESVSSVFGSISEGVKEINSATSELTMASNEQKLGIDQVTTAAHQIDESIQTNVAMAQESESLADKLVHDNARLKSATDNLVELVYGENGNSDSVRANPVNTDPQSPPSTKEKEDLIERNQISADDDSFNPAA